MRWLLFVCAMPALSQGFHAGVKAGVPLTQYFETGASGSLHGGAEYSAATRRYTVGASVEWEWTHAFGFEADALYHRMGYVGIVHFIDSANGNYRDSAIDVKGNSWDFPLLVKYRFGRSGAAVRGGRGRAAICGSGARPRGADDRLPGDQDKFDDAARHEPAF
jgi:hypothetical protein